MRKIFTAFVILVVLALLVLGIASGVGTVDKKGTFHSSVVPFIVIYHSQPWLYNTETHSSGSMFEEDHPSVPSDHSTVPQDHPVVPEEHPVEPVHPVVEP